MGVSHLTGCGMNQYIKEMALCLLMSSPFAIFAAYVAFKFCGV